jgi:AraC-like DNA-binding protein
LTKQKQLRLGRPVDEIRQQVFSLICDHLENSNEDTLKKLCDMMVDFGCCEPYSPTYLKKKFSEKFGDNLIVTSKSGLSDIVTLSPTSSKVLREYHESKTQNEEEENIRIIQAAGRIIRDEIVRKNCSTESYDIDDIFSSPEESLSFCTIKLQILLG